MRRKRRGQALWLRVVAAGLAAVAVTATAADGGSHASSVATTGPGCVVLSVA